MPNIFDTTDLNIDFSLLEQDLIKRAKSRLLYQFKNSEVLNSLIQEYVTEIQDVYDAGKDCLDGRTITKAVGVNLDVIGDIVGQSRILKDSQYISFFTPDASLKGADQAPAWVENAPTTGVRQVDDSAYRRYIFGKIFKNHTRYGSIIEARAAGSLCSGKKISFQKVGVAEYMLAVPNDLDINSILTLVSSLSNTQIDSTYFLPIPASVLLHKEDLLVVITDENGNGISFRPDNEDGRADYGRATIVANI